MSPGHYLCQRSNENVATLMGRHRSAIRELKNELKQIEESEHEPKEKEYVRNLLLASLEPVKGRITELMLEAAAAASTSKNRWQIYSRAGVQIRCGVHRSKVQEYNDP